MLERVAPRVVNIRLEHKVEFRLALREMLPCVVEHGLLALSSVLRMFLGAAEVLPIDKIHQAILPGGICHAKQRGGRPSRGAMTEEGCGCEVLYAKHGVDQALRLAAVRSSQVHVPNAKRQVLQTGPPHDTLDNPRGASQRSVHNHTGLLLVVIHNVANDSTTKPASRTEACAAPTRARRPSGIRGATSQRPERSKGERRLTRAVALRRGSIVVLHICSGVFDVPNKQNTAAVVKAVFDQFAERSKALQLDSVDVKNVCGAVTGVL